MNLEIHMPRIRSSTAWAVASLAACALFTPFAFGAADISSHRDDGAHAGATQSTASGPATTPQRHAQSATQPRVQNHTQGEVPVECLREDPRKGPDPACSKLKSMRHPRPATASR